MNNKIYHIHYHEYSIVVQVWNALWISNLGLVSSTEVLKEINFPIAMQCRFENDQHLLYYILDVLCNE